MKPRGGALPVLAAVLLLAPAVHAQEMRAVEPVALTPHVVAYGSASPFDLSRAGPVFAHSWIGAALPALTASDETPPLRQRVTAGADSSAGAPVRTTYERANDGRPLVRRVERRRGTAWIPVRRTRYTYRQDGLAGQHTAVWLDGAWHPDQHLTLTRGPDGSVDTVLHRTRRGGRWQHHARLTLAPIDTSGSYRLVRATWNDGMWHPAQRITFRVAEGGRYITQRSEVWTRAGWENDQRRTYAYDAAGYPIEQTLAVWTGTRWAEGPLHFYDYHVHGQHVTQRTEIWVGTNRIRVERAELTYAAPVAPPLLGTASFD